MVEKERGSPDRVESVLAKTRGRFRTYLQKQARKLPVSPAAAIVLAFGIKATALEAVRVTTDALAPRVPVNSRLLVNKLRRQVDVDDVIVFRLDKERKLGVVKQINDDHSVVVYRQGRPETLVRSEQIIGKAVFLYSYAL